MASKMYNRARMTVTSTGTGSLSLGVAVAGYQTFSSSGAQNGDTVSYTIEDGVNWEVGTGTFNSVAGTLSRTVTQSYNGTSYGTTAISVTTNAQVYITALAADIVVSGGALGTPSSATLTNATGLPLATGVTGTLPVANGGTGLTSLTAGYIPYGNGTGAFSSSSGLYFDGTNLGVGTSTIVQKLTVNGSVYVPDGYAYTFGSSASYISGNSASNFINFVTSSSERMRLDASGNLGLGVTPSAKFDVQTSSNKRIQFLDASHGSLTGLASGITFSRGSDTANLAAIFGWNTGGLAIAAREGITFATGGAGTYTSTTQAMTLDASGNLLVGTTSAGTSAKVNIAGGALQLADGQPVQWGGQNTYWVGYNAGILLAVTNGSERARIDASGNLLVGATGFGAGGGGGGKIAVANTPSSQWGIDFSNATTGSITNGSNYAFGAGSGLIFITESGVNGASAIYLVGGGVVTLVSTSDATFWSTPTTTPASGKASIAYSGTAYTVYNNQGGARTFYVAMIKTRNAN